MISIRTVLLLLAVHFVADFVLQSDRMAQGKSKSNWVLGEHVSIYFFALCLFFPVQFALFNALAHFVTDYFTSRINSHLWAKKQVHNFFVGVGFDQLIHGCSLVASYKLFSP